MEIEMEMGKMKKQFTASHFLDADSSLFKFIVSNE